MSPEEFLKCLRTSRKLILDAAPYKKEIGLGNFLTYFSQYKNEVFFDFSQEDLNSSSFQWYVLEVMSMVRHLDRFNASTPTKLPQNVVNINDYRKNLSFKAAI